MTIPTSGVAASTPLIPIAGGEASLLDELTATLAPRIQVVSLLGRGGMAHVFLGRDPLLKRSIAIKVLAPQYAGVDVARMRFTREAQAAATMNHPNVAAVYDVGELPSGTPYFLMQFVDGNSLAHIIDSEGMLAEPRARRIIGEIASALAAAHARGLVHRDVKPANVIVETESKRAVVVDFGISAALNKEQFAGEGTLTEVGTYVGTPRYTSPEQAANEKVSGKSDVYSLGVVAFEVLTGRAVFEGTNPMALLAAHIKDTPLPVRTLRPDLDAGFAALVDRCLLKDPSARPEAAEIASFLVPEPQAAIEWPPPGLEELRGQGARTARAFNWFGTFAVLFVLALATQPTRGTPQWNDFERSTVWSVVANMWAGTGIGETPDATPVWLFVLMLAYVGAQIAFIVYVIRSGRLLGALRHGRRQGYSLQVLAAVAADDYADTAQLLNRSGHFAVLSAEQQRRLVQARRSAVAVLPGAFLLCCVLMMYWFSGLLSSRGSTALFGPAQATVMLLPVVVGLILLGYLFALELPLRRGSLWTGPKRMAARAEFVRDWLKRLKDPEQLRFAPAALVIPALGLVAGGVLLFALTVAGLAIVISTQNVSKATRGHATQYYLADGWSATDSRLVDALDSLIATMPPLPRIVNDSVNRLLAIDAFTQLAHRAEHPGVDDPIGEAEAKVAAAAARRALASLGAGNVDTKSHIEGDRLATAFAHLRQFARASDPSKPTVANIDQWRPFIYPTEELLQEHAEGRLHVPWFLAPGLDGAYPQFRSALAARRYADGRAIGFDLIRAASRLIRSPITDEHDRGVNMAVEGATMLGRVARETGDAALTGIAATVAQRATAVHRRRWGTEPRRRFDLLWAYAGSLGESTEATVMAGDPRLMPYERWLVMRGFVTAYCTNAREILFGVSPRRSRLIGDAIVPDIVRNVQWVRIHRGMADRWVEDPAKEFERVMPAVTRERSAIDVLRWLGFRDLHARLRFCASPALLL